MFDKSFDSRTERTQDRARTNERLVTADPVKIKKRKKKKKGIHVVVFYVFDENPKDEKRFVHQTQGE